MGGWGGGGGEEENERRKGRIKIEYPSPAPNLHALKKRKIYTKKFLENACFIGYLIYEARGNVGFYEIWYGGLKDIQFLPPRPSRPAPEEKRTPLRVLPNQEKMVHPSLAQPRCTYE